MKYRRALIISFVFLLLIIICYCNWKFELIAINPCYDNEQYELKVMTWNVHCSNGTDIMSQKKIAEMIMKVDADFVQLNEFYQDSCLVVDSLLSEHFPYKEDVNAKTKAGDIIYSKIPLVESGRYKTSIKDKAVQALQTKIIINEDSVFIIGCHLWGNNHQGQIGVDNTDSISKVKTFWERYRNAQEKRKKDISNIKKTILECKLPAILMGDMNDFSASAPMDSLNDVDMKNAWWEGGFGYGATYHEGWLRLRIDHIYYNDKLKLKDVKVVETDLSDHNILVADFEFAN